MSLFMIMNDNYLLPIEKLCQITLYLKENKRTENSGKYFVNYRTLRSWYKSPSLGRVDTAGHYLPPANVPSPQNRLGFEVTLIPAKQSQEKNPTTLYIQDQHVVLLSSPQHSLAVFVTAGLYLSSAPFCSVLLLTHMLCVAGVAAPNFKS